MLLRPDLSGISKQGFDGTTITYKRTSHDHHIYGSIQDCIGIKPL